METQKNDQANQSRPTREEADAALQDASRIRSGFEDRPVPVPWWYFPALAVSMVAIALAQLLPTFWTIAVTILVAAAIGATVGFAVRKARYMPRVSLVQMLPFVVPAVALVILAIILDRQFGQRWVWYIVAVVAVVFIYLVAVYHRRHLEGNINGR